MHKFLEIGSTEHLRYPDTLPNCRTGIAIRIRYRYFPIRLRYGIGKYRRKRKIRSISILLNALPIRIWQVSVQREGSRTTGEQLYYGRGACADRSIDLQLDLVAKKACPCSMQTAVRHQGSGGLLLRASARQATRVSSSGAGAEQLPRLSERGAGLTRGVMDGGGCVIKPCAARRAIEALA
jgi:hypothetical protein